LGFKFLSQCQHISSRRGFYNLRTTRPKTKNISHHYISIMAGYFCPSTTELDPAVFNDVCVAHNNEDTQANWNMTQAAFKTCCSPNNYAFTDDFCYFYCNITAPLDTVMFGNCLADAVPANWDWSQFDWDCYPLAWETASDTRPGDIATTWTYPDNTWTDTITLSNGVVTTATITDNYWGTPLTAMTTSSAKVSSKATGPTATKTTASTVTKSTSSSAALTSSTKPSGAGFGVQLSCGAVALIALSVLTLVF
jgi:hypothetical protein